MDLEPMYPGFKSLESHKFFLLFFLLFFFYVFFCHYYYSANLQIQHYGLYSDSPTLFITPYDAHASSAFSALIFL